MLAREWQAVSPSCRVFTEAFLRRWHLSRGLCEVGDGEEEVSRQRKLGGKSGLSQPQEKNLPTTQSVPLSGAWAGGKR